LIGILGFLIYVVILFLFAMKAVFFRRRKLYPLGIALLLGIAISIFYNANLQTMVNVLFGIVLFNLVLSDELRSIRLPIAVLGLIFLLLFSGEGPLALAVPLMLGLSSELFSEREYESRVNNKEIEIRRDFVHLFGGVLLFVIFLLLSYTLDGYVVEYVFILGLLAVFYAELWKNSRFSMALYSIEKHKDYVGYGAIWLGVGTLVAYVFLDKSFFLLAILAIYFADPVATFAGNYWRSSKLPHNRRKSVAGSFAYFLIVAIPGYILVGPLAILFALLGAAVESLPIKLDDNFSVSVALSLLFLVLLYIGVI
jgi:dolichol kinase